MSGKNHAIFCAILAAALYAISSPASKLLLNHIPSTMLAGLLYLGAGIGMAVIRRMRRFTGKEEKELPLSRKDLPFTVCMILLDIAAPILMMLGLTMTSAANASLLNNFEIVATSVIAWVIFRERIPRKLWAAILLITFSSMLLSFEDISSLSFSAGSLLVLAACICWGFENNCTRMLSSKDPAQIVVIKGLFSGAGALIIASLSGEGCTEWLYILFALLLGFAAYGLSIYFYIYAQRYIGAAKTSAYYAISPFIGTALSLILFRDPPSPTFIAALIIMIIGAWLAA